MKVNAHKQIFFQSFTCVFLLRRVKTGALLRMNRHFFSPLSAFFSYTMCSSGNSALLCIHLKALVFLYAFEESVDCNLLSSFCDDSNLHISLFKYFHDGCKQGIDQQILIGNRFHVKLRILSPENCKQAYG